MATPDKKVEIRIETTSDRKGIDQAQRSIKDLSRDIKEIEAGLAKASPGSSEFKAIAEQAGEARKRLQEVRDSADKFATASCGTKQWRTTREQAIF